MADLHVGVGLSEEPDTEAAARDAAGEAMRQAGIDRAGWALCFFTGPHMARADALRTVIIQAARCESLTGCSAMGVVGRGREIEGRAALAVMVGATPRIDVQSALLPHTGEGLAGLGALAEGSGRSPMLLAMPDAFHVDTPAFVARCNRELGRVPVFGAGSTDDGSLGISLQLGMEGVRARSISTMSFAGELEVAVGLTQSCVPVGEPHFITAAEDHLLIELDSRPALMRYIETGQQLGMASFQDAVQEIMFGFPLDPERPSFEGEACVVRHLAGLEQAHHALVMPQPVPLHHTMSFMHRNGKAAERDMHRMIAGVRARLSGPPAFGVYFDCAGRGQGLYGRNGVDSAAIRERLGDFPLIGMFGGYELATTLGSARMYTYTGVLVLVRVPA